MTPVSRGEEYIINIESVASSGNGVGHINGFTVFVKGAVGGDCVKARITRVKKSFAEAEIAEILEKSPDRAEPDCQHNDKCGGCQLRHIKYAAQLEIKKEIVENAVKRIGGFSDFKLEEIIGADNPAGYRNKAVFRFGYSKNRILCGFFSPKSRTVTDVGGCLICGEDFTEIASAAAEYANKFLVHDRKSNVLESVFVRSSHKTGEIAVVISSNAKKLPRTDELVRLILDASDKISGILLEFNGKTRVLYGNKTLTEEICGIKFKVSPESFLQVNPSQTKKLYDKALEFADIKNTDTVMDIYCGIGTITLAAAKTAKRVIGIEKVERAIEDAKVNAELNGIGNAAFYAGDAEDIVPRLVENGEKPDIVILDPPRSGSDEKTLSAIAAARPDRIVYVSCDPASLARDLKFICGYGYKITRAAACDMFPHTCHVETVCLLSKLNDEHHIKVG